MRSPALPFIAIMGVTAAVIATVVLLPAQHTAGGGSAKPQPEVAKAATPMILQEADGDQLVHRAGPLRGLPFTIKVDGQVGNSEDFFVFSETLAPGQTIPFHKHENAEELLIFQEPGASVIVGDKAGLAGPQSIVFIPRDTWISATNTSGKDLHTMAVFSRHGFESYMRAIAVNAGQPLTPLTQEELTRLRTAGHAVTGIQRKALIRPV